jgi:cell division protein FtsB
MANPKDMTQLEFDLGFEAAELRDALVAEKGERAEAEAEIQTLRDENEALKAEIETLKAHGSKLHHGGSR